MKVTRDELVLELSYLRNGIRGGYKDFKIPLWLAEYLVDNLIELFDGKKEGQ